MSRTPLCEEYEFIRLRMQRIEDDKREAQTLRAFSDTPLAYEVRFRHPQIVASSFWKHSDNDAKAEWFDDHASRKENAYLHHVREKIGEMSRMSTANDAYIHPNDESDIVRNTVVLFCRLVLLNLV